MEGTIANYRQSRHTTKGNQVVIVIPDVDTKEKAKKLIGKKVIYNTGKKEIKGEIRGSHGNKGAVRVLFETGMPGQSLTKKVKII
jgi:large subunit ribosomal protein L35Ae